MRESVLQQWETMLAEAGTAPTKMDRGVKMNDVLIVVDMQVDFVEGSVAVAEGVHAAHEAVRMIRHAAGLGTKIIAVKTFHPMNHNTFKKGLMPPHCLQGTTGADFYGPIADALTYARHKAAERHEHSVHICYKGMHDEINSPGALPYGPQFALQRLQIADTNHIPLEWTGSFELNASARDINIDAHPDMRSILKKTPIKELLWGLPEGHRIFICGLSFDYSVLDTACAASILGKKSLHIVFDATRPFYFPEKGKFRGFCSSPNEVHKLLEHNDIKLCKASDFLK